jgi:hypothetical protein
LSLSLSGRVGKFLIPDYLLTKVEDATMKIVAGEIKVAGAMAK